MSPRDAWRFLRTRTDAALMGVGYGVFNDDTGLWETVVDGIRASAPNGGPYQIFNERAGEYDDAALLRYVNECVAHNRRKGTRR